MNKYDTIKMYRKFGMVVNMTVDMTGEMAVEITVNMIVNRSFAEHLT